MNSALIALELRKNRMTLTGLAASFAVVAPLSLLVAPRAGLGAAAAVESGLILWTLAGLPLSAAFLGAAAGAGLRAEGVREPEASFPGSPLARIARGFAGALLQFLLLAAATALISALASPGWRSAVLGSGEGPKIWAMVSPLRCLLVLFSFEILSGSFLAAYALGHAPAGGLIGAALGAGECAALGLGLQYALIYPDRADAFGPIAVLVGALGLAAKAAAARPLAARLERARPLGAPFLAATALLMGAGLLGAWSAEESAFARLRSSLRLKEPSSGVFFLTLGPSPEDDFAAIAPAARGGALAATVSGGLIWITPEGRPVRLLPDDEMERFLFGGDDARIEAMMWGGDGTLLVSRRLHRASGTKTEWWSGRPAEGLRPVDALGGEIAGAARKPDGGVGVVVTGKDFKTSFCAVGADARIENCVPDRLYAPAGSGAPKYDSRLARLAKDGLSLSMPGPNARTWRLPGHASDEPGPQRPYLVNGKAAYFVLVRIGDDEAVAVCREDGRVQTVWRHSWSGVRGIGGLSLDVLPDGTLVYQYGYDWNVVDKDGNFPPQVVTKRVFERWPRPAGAPLHTPRLVHREGGRDWILFEGNRLVEMEESTGMPVKSSPLPVPVAEYDPKSLRVLERGLILQGAAGTSFFVSWDGGVRTLRAP